ncbi:uncharacterized protein An04g00310 [Aspergillus niger]|uniref:Contig An04c0010, genomic contig n=2 Tax=Aspergillus niger TaxID=5061 RepID=A2QHL6_ASPNC|nr:uncharacterized protein An04g00310 [Aspergillus niger]CAK38486.1 unnamed protein product [Aspergillus niger]
MEGDNYQGNLKRLLMQNKEEHEGIYVLCRRGPTDVVDYQAMGRDQTAWDLQLLPPSPLPEISQEPAGPEHHIIGRSIEDVHASPCAVGSLCEGILLIARGPGTRIPS